MLSQVSAGDHAAQAENVAQRRSQATTACHLDARRAGLRTMADEGDLASESAGRSHRDTGI